MARTYLGFASNDKLTWIAIGEVLASGAEQALTKFRNGDPVEHKLYAVCPQRNWSSGEPEVVQPPPVVKWKGVDKDQLDFSQADIAAEDEEETVEDLIEELEQEGLIEEVAIPKATVAPTEPPPTPPGEAVRKAT